MRAASEVKTAKTKHPSFTLSVENYWFIYQLPSLEFTTHLCKKKTFKCKNFRLHENQPLHSNSDIYCKFPAEPHLQVTTCPSSTHLFILLCWSNDDWNALSRFKGKYKHFFRVHSTSVFALSIMSIIEIIFIGEDL